MAKIRKDKGTGQENPFPIHGLVIAAEMSATSNSTGTW